jgi:hypothetical protein
MRHATGITMYFTNGGSQARATGGGRENEAHPKAKPKAEYSELPRPPLNRRHEDARAKGTAATGWSAHQRQDVSPAQSSRRPGRA